MKLQQRRISFMQVVHRACPPALILAVLVVYPGLAQPQEIRRAHDMVLNGETRTYMEGQQGREELRGRVSGHLRFTAESLEKGVVLVEAFNWVAFGVDQRSITGIKPEGKPTSALGFTVSTREPQVLKYDERKGTLSGELQGQLSLDQFFELTSPKDRGSGHDLDMRTLPAVLEVSIVLGSRLQPPKGEQGVDTRNVDAKMLIRAEPYKALRLHRKLELESTGKFRLEADWTLLLETARSLCIQPVRIGRFIITWHEFGFGMRIPSFSFVYSGDGLNFGKPNAGSEWAKADITFVYRDWMTIFNSGYSTLSSGEKSALRAEVNEDDCIEVFFVDRFDPQDMDGGGVTSSGGTESSKVISSDENADFGVDDTHLAHELGHVLTLKHPGSGFPTAASPHRVDGSSGTLICPSGFNNDNPEVNSEWNEDNAANPLLKFTLKIVSAGPDCENDADCGACPAIP